MYKKEFALNLQSEAFSEFNQDLNARIIECLGELHDGYFVGGDITAKISIDLRTHYESYPVGIDEQGRQKSKSYKYKRPGIDYKVTLMLKKREESKGSYDTRQMELKKKGDGFMLAEVKQAQLTLDEVGRLPENERTVTITAEQTQAAVEAWNKRK